MLLEQPVSHSSYIENSFPTFEMLLCQDFFWYVVSDVSNITSLTIASLK